MQTILLQAFSGGSIPTPILFALMIAVFYWFIIRPQNKQKKEIQSLIDNLKKGDKIITTGGLHGRIIQDNETNFLVDFGSNTKIKVEKSAISMELTKELNKTEENK